MRKLDLFRVNMPKDVHLALQPVLESGFVSEGPKAKEYEKAIQEWLGNPYTAIVNSGTSALTIAMRLAGVGPGTSVVTTPLTCLATNEPIQSLGARVIWCDIDPDTGCLDPDKLEACIEDDTVAVVFVDWAGAPCRIDEITRIARQHGLKTIQDAAHSLGSRYWGWNTGNPAVRSDYTCFSTQAIKHLTTVDGGFLACQNQEDYDRAVLLRWFSCSRGHNTGSRVQWSGDVMEYGYKMHMNDVNATIGLEGLKTIDAKIALHKRNGKLLASLLSNVPGVEAMKYPKHVDSSYWIFTLKAKDEEARNRLSEGLTALGVGNGIVHTRNDEYSLFKDSRKHLPALDDFAPRMLNVPCGWWLSEDDVHFIADSIKELVA